MTMIETPQNEMTRPAAGPPLAVAAPRGTVAPALITDEHRQILRAMVDRNATPAQVEMLIVIGNRYDLDPLMGHVVLINGKCFVTHKGLMHKAHTSGAFDGIRHSYGHDEQGDYCECSVFRKDMSHPFEGRIYLDEYRAAGPVWKQYPRAMAAKTAESFVLRRAFDVSLTSQEEMGVDRLPETAGTENGAAEPRGQRPPLGPAPQRDRLPAPAPDSGGTGPGGTPACLSCSRALTRAQQELSVRNYGQALCPACQKQQGQKQHGQKSLPQTSGPIAERVRDQDDSFDNDDFEGLVQDSNGNRDMSEEVAR